MVAAVRAVVTAAARAVVKAVAKVVVLEGRDMLGTPHTCLVHPIHAWYSPIHAWYLAFAATEALGSTGEWVVVVVLPPPPSVP